MCTRHIPTPNLITVCIINTGGPHTDINVTSTLSFFSGRWLFGLLLCDFFVTSDVLMCTSSILHLCTISLERYIGIRYPLWTKNKSKRVVLLKIVLVWTLSLAISSPIAILGVVKEDNVLVDGSCVLNNEYFIIYGSITAFYIPLAIMVLMYALTTRMLNKQARLCNSRPAEDGEGQPMIRRSTSRRNWQARRKFYGREARPSYSGAQGIEGGIVGVMAPFHQRYRTVGVNRHNTVPVRYHHVPRRLHNDVSVGDGGSGSTAGSNSNINSFQKGGSYQSAAVVNNNNNSNNCITDNNTSTSHASGGGRRNRYALANGTDSTVYLGLKQVSEFSYCNGRQEEITADANSDPQNCCTSRVSSSSSSPSPTSSSNREGKRLRDLVRKHHVAVKAANILLMKRDNQGQGQTSVPSSSNTASVRRDNSVRTEQKASKVLGVVFMIFVVCWAPFFTVNILTALCTSCKFENTLITVFVWLGYVSSTLNPIIYTIFNNIFRITFIKLLCCRYRLLHRANKRNAALPGIRNGLLNCTTFCPAQFVASATPNTTSSIFEESHC